MTKQKRENINVLYIIIKKYPAMFFLSLWMTFILGIYPGTLVLAVKSFVNSIVGIMYLNAEIKIIATSGSYLILAFAGYPLFNIITRYINLCFHKKLERFTRTFFIQKEENLDVQEAENDKTLDDIEILTDDIANVFYNRSMDVLYAVQIILNYISLAVSVLDISGKLVIILLILLFPLGFVGYICGNRQFEVKEVVARKKRYVKYLQDVMVKRDAAGERQLFQYKKYLLKKWDTVYKEYIKEENFVDIKNMVNMEITGLFVNIIFGSTIIYCIYEFIGGRCDVGIIVGLVSQMLTFTGEIRWGLMDAFLCFAKNHRYDKRLYEFVNLSERISKGKSSISKVNSIEFKKVSFMYPGTKELVLKSISFKLEKGNKYVFIGKNGSGKSTITKLLLGLYTDYTGQILINGIDIKDINREELQNMFGVVFQDFSIYPFSIKENILANNDYDKEHYENVLKRVQLYDYICSLKEKDNTVIGKLSQEDTVLSGGLLQKIAISRSMYGKHSIYIMDEPTSALDPTSEFELYKNFVDNEQLETVLMITHRMGVARLSDYVYVLEEGKIREQGTHESLMSKRGLYFNMYEKQRGWYDEP